MATDTPRVRRCPPPPPTDRRPGLGMLAATSRRGGLGRVLGAHQAGRRAQRPRRRLLPDLAGRRARRRSCSWPRAAGVTWRLLRAVAAGAASPSRPTSCSSSAPCRRRASPTPRSSARCSRCSCWRSPAASSASGRALAELAWGAVAVRGHRARGARRRRRWRQQHLGQRAGGGALVAWTAYFVFTKTARQELTAFEYLTGMAIVAAVVVVPLPLLFEGTPRHHRRRTAGSSIVYITVDQRAPRPLPHGLRPRARHASSPCRC